MAVSPLKKEMHRQTLQDPISKRMMRWGWSTLLGAHAFASVMTAGSGRTPAVFYGGARSGDIGGPLVKIKRLSRSFPEHLWRFNTVYILSNAAYLPATALELFRKKRIPTVHNQNGVFYPAWFTGDWRARNERMARSYHMADYVFYQSGFCRDCAKRFLGERQGPGEVLFNAVDTDFFRPSEDRAAGPQGRPFRFLVTGKIDEHLFYRVESTLCGLAEARRQGLECDLEVAGWMSEGALRRSKDLASGLGIDSAVAFSGAYTQEQAPAVYRSADAYVLTKHNDPCPNTVLEAMSCGLPVVYSDSGGVPELVGASGIAVACGESWDRPQVPATGDVAAAMLEAAAHRQALSKAARDRAVATFGLNDWISRHRAVFESLLAARS